MIVTAPFTLLAGLVEQIASIEWGGVLPEVLRDSIASDGRGGFVGQFEGWTHHCHPLVGPHAAQQREADGRLVAPFHGRVIDVTKSVGELVAAGDIVMRLEAMKMEHVIAAPIAGEIVAIQVGPGDQVSADELLAELVPVEQDDLT